MEPRELELERLTGAPPRTEAPAEIDVLEVRVADPQRAWGRVREVLTAVLEAPLGEWPAPDEWRRRLPLWFVEACLDDAAVQDCNLDRWSLRAWVYWLQPERRGWRWWDAEAAGDVLRVRILVWERPYLRGALEWLLRVAAA